MASAEADAAATRIQARARGRTARKNHWETTHRRHVAATNIQLHIRKHQATLTVPDLRIASAYADSLMPRGHDGHLYRTCGRVDFEAFDELGVNVGCYMRFIWWGVQVFGACSIISVVPIMLNLGGSGEHLLPSNAVFTYHTLGNAPRVHWLQGACDTATTTILLVALVSQQAAFRRRAARQVHAKRHGGAAALSVTDYTLQVGGLPRSSSLHGGELRSYFEQWGDVVAVSVSRAQRALLALLMKRDGAAKASHDIETRLLRLQLEIRELPGGDGAGGALRAATAAYERASVACGPEARARALRRAWQREGGADGGGGGGGDLEAPARPAKGGAKVDARLAPHVAKWLALKLSLHEARRALRRLEADVTQRRKQRTACTGIAFITFNEQRAAHACYASIKRGTGHKFRLARPTTATARRASITATPASAASSSPPPPSHAGGDRGSSSGAAGAPTPSTTITGRLTAAFATHPQNIIWENLQITDRETFRRGLAVNGIMICVVLVNSLCIVLATNVNTRKGVDEDLSPGEKWATTIWSLLVIIVCNVSILLTTPNLALQLECYHTVDRRETALLRKMLFFQCFNGFAAALCFLWCLTFLYDDSSAETDDADDASNASSLSVVASSVGGADDSGGTCPEGHEGYIYPLWYSTGGAAVFNVLLGDVAVVLCVIEGLRIFDKVPLRQLTARGAATQPRMNEIFAFQDPLLPNPGLIYLPFRLQLVLKFIVFGVPFAAGLPLLLPVTLLMFVCSWFIDKHNILRVFHLPATSDRLLEHVMVDYIPLGIAFKVVMSFFFFRHATMHELHQTELDACADAAVSNATAFATALDDDAADGSSSGSNATALFELARSLCEADYMDAAHGDDVTPRGMSPLSALARDAMGNASVRLSLVTAAVALPALLCYVLREHSLRLRTRQDAHRRMATLPDSGTEVVRRLRDRLARVTQSGMSRREQREATRRAAAAEAAIGAAEMSVIEESADEAAWTPPSVAPTGAATAASAPPAAAAERSRRARASAADEATQRARIARAFAVFDADGSGTLTPDELKAILTRPVARRPPKFTAGAVDALVARYDANGDGVLSIDEFASAWAALGADEMAAGGGSLPRPRPSEAQEEPPSGEQAEQAAVATGVTAPAAAPAVLAAAPAVLAAAPAAAAAGGASVAEQSFALPAGVTAGDLLCFRDLGSSEMYVPPLTATLLKLDFGEAQAKQKRVSASTRIDEYERSAAQTALARHEQHAKDLERDSNLLGDAAVASPRQWGSSDLLRGSSDLLRGSSRVAASLFAETSFGQRKPSGKQRPPETVSV